VKLAIRDQGDFSGRRNAQPVPVEQAHELAHAGDPHVAIYQIVAGHEYVLASLQRGEGFFEWPPNSLAYGINTIEFIKRMDAPKAVVGSCMFLYGRGGISG